MLLSDQPYPYLFVRQGAGSGAVYLRTGPTTCQWFCPCGELHHTQPKEDKIVPIQLHHLQRIAKWGKLTRKNLLQHCPAELRAEFAAWTRKTYGES